MIYCTQVVHTSVIPEPAEARWQLQRLVQLINNSQGQTMRSSMGQVLTRRFFGPDQLECLVCG